MANLAPTAANVVPDDGFVYVDGVAGETLTAGMLVYLKSSDTRYWKAHCETSAATAVVAGVVLNGASAGQRVSVMTGGTVTIGDTVGVGTIYILSTAGLICPVTDLATSDYVTILGTATTAAKIKLGILVSGVLKAA
jgi:hypothetical protein